MSRAAKGADCKSAGYAFAGSSPASPTTSHLNLIDTLNSSMAGLRAPTGRSVAEGGHGLARCG